MMMESVEDKILQHVKDTNKLSDSELEECKKIFKKKVRIYFCENCEINTFGTQYRSIMQGELKDYSEVPKCYKCNSLMKRIVINKVDNDVSVKDFLRASRPKIFCFILSKNIIEDGDLSVGALAEDGDGLVSHYSSEGFAKIDIGLTSESHHEKYCAKYPDGFELIWVEDKDFDSNKEVHEAYKLSFLRLLSSIFIKAKERRENND
jgi:hypothetical protein